MVVHVQHLINREGVLIVLDDGVEAAAAASAAQEATIADGDDASTPVQAPRPVRAEDERILAVNPNYVLD